MLAAPVHAAPGLPFADPPATPQRVVVPSGDMRAVTVDDFRPRAPLSSTYSEVWTYVLLLNDGMQATFSISRANLGRIMGSISGAEFSISGFNGQTYRANKEYPAENLRFTPASERLEVHPNVFVEGPLSGPHRIRFHASKHGIPFEVELTLTDITRGFTWGDGIFRLGSDQMGLFIHIPHARVSGTVTIDGQTRQVRGTAYMDQTFQTDYATRLVRGAFRYVQHGANPEVGLFVLPAYKFEDRVIGFGGARSGRSFRLIRPEQVNIVSTRQALGADVPRQLSLRFHDGRQTIINRGADGQAFSVLEELSSIQRTVVRRFVGGEALVFRGMGTTNLREPVAYDYLIIR